MGRLKTWAEAGTATSPAASTANEYDANGNIRRTQSSFANLGATGAVVWTSAKDHWYRYDSMNRLVTDQGQLSGVAGAGGTLIVRNPNGGGGRDISYDAAGQRTSVATTFYEAGWWELVPGEGGGIEEPMPDDEYVYHPGWWQERRENYVYDGAGRLAEVRNTAGSAVYEAGEGTGVPSGPLPAAASTGGYVRGSFAYDLLGRLTLQQDYAGYIGTGFSGPSYSRSIAYNAKGQVTSDDVSTAKGRYGNYTAWDIFRSVTTYTYGTGSSYALGSVVSQTAVNTKLASGGGGWTSQPGTLTSTAYAWYDGAVQDLVTHDYDTGSGSNPLYTTDLQLNAFGQLSGALVNDGVPKSSAYTLDEAGQIIRRDETRTGAPAEAAPHEIFYRFAGRQMGMTGNNGTTNMSYVQSTDDRAARRPDPTSATAGLFRDGTKTGSAPTADFSMSYDAYNSDYQGSAGGVYTVRTGDTLASIAQALWGDANLWYKLAAANGMSANAGLIEGQTLTLPTGVTRSSHSAATFKPYDPTDALGDLSPTTPKPPKKPKCGVFGMILVAAIAIGVAAILGPQMIAAFSTTATATTTTVAAGITVTSTATFSTIGAAGAIAAGAITGAAASAVSQLAGMAIGAQSGFSWKGVGLAALGGAVGGAMGGDGLFGSKGAFGGVKSDIVQAGLRGVTSNAAIQGLGLATGLQSKFDFAGVAAAGAVSGIGNLTSGKLPGAVTATRAASTGNVIVSSAAGAIAGAATRSALTGESFGDNLMRVTPDVVANSLILLGGAVVAQRGGNDGGGSHIRRTSAGSIAYLDEPEGGGSINDIVYPTPIIITAPRQAGAALSIVDWVLGVVGATSPFRAHTFMDIGTRVGMSLTNPAPQWAELPTSHVSMVERRDYSARMGREAVRTIDAALGAVGKRLATHTGGTMIVSLDHYNPNSGGIASTLTDPRYSEWSGKTRPQTVGDLTELALEAGSILPALKLPKLVRAGVAAETVSPRLIGSYTPSAELKYGTTLFGDEAHAAAGAMLREQLEAQGVTGIIDRTGPGLRGVDMSVPEEFVGKLGFEHIEIKPNTVSGLGTFNRQVDRWGYDPTTVKAVTYDAHGNIWWGFDF